MLTPRVVQFVDVLSQKSELLHGAKGRVVDKIFVLPATPGGPSNPVCPTIPGGPYTTKKPLKFKVLFCEIFK